MNNKHLLLWKNSPKLHNSFQVPGGWGEWGTFTSCNQPCGGGTKDRVRQCDNPAPINKGRYCDGFPHESESCNAHSCSGNSVCSKNASRFIIFKFCNIYSA